MDIILIFSVVPEYPDCDCDEERCHAKTRQDKTSQSKLRQLITKEKWNSENWKKIEKKNGEKQYAHNIYVLLISCCRFQKDSLLFG